MKKVLSTALAIGLVAGIASTASAAFDSFTISGYYQALGKFATSVDGSGIDLGTDARSLLQTGDEDVNSAWWQHNLRLYPTLNINDKTKLIAELRVLDTTSFGSPATGGGGLGTTGSTLTREIDVNKVYMQYASPVGKLQIGRVPFGTYGTSKFNDGATRRDGIKYFPSFIPKPFSMILFTVKYNEGDVLSANNDADSDAHGIYLNYKQDAVMAGARYWTVIDKQASATSTGITQRFDGFAKVDFNNYYVNGEFGYSFGETDSDTASLDRDVDAMSFILEAGGSFGALNGALSYWYLEGDNVADSATNDNTAWGDANNDFQPLLIMTGEDAALMNNKSRTNVYEGGAKGTGMQTAGAHMLMAQFGYKVSDKLSLNGVVGGGWADDEATNYDDSYGWEIDAGFAYKLLDNLTYSANIGYWDAGDFYTERDSTTTADNAQASSSFIAVHALNMTF